MKLLKKSTALLLAAVIALSCMGVIAFAAPTIKSMKIVQMPAKTTFYRGNDWDYGYWNFPVDGTGKGEFEERADVISFMHRGGLYSYYQDRGMLDMNGLVVEVTYSDGSKKNVAYKETVSGTTVNQNILASPKNGYKLGKNTIEIYFLENTAVYTTYEINIVDNAEPQKLMGDVDFNNIVNSTDALLILQHVVEISVFNAAQKAVADMNADGKINSADALAVLKLSVGQA